METDAGKAADGEATTPLIATDISKTYRAGHQSVHALHGTSLTVRAGQSLAIMGPSGCGKTTLLKILGLTPSPTEGEVRVDGRPAPDSERERARIRNERYGFIPQNYAILNEESVWENVVIPLEYRHPHVSRSQRRELARTALETVGLAHKWHTLPTRLSGGQRQRVAVARTIVTRPSILIADEPTAALDSDNARQVMELLLDQCAQGTALIVATHDPVVAAMCRTQLYMRDGQLTADRTMFTGATEARIS